MTHRLVLKTYLIFISLLSPVSAGAGGFVVHREDIPRCAGVQSVGAYLLFGGMYRWGDTYLTLDEGVGDLVDFNYVEGFQLGPQATVGHLTPGGHRWEVSPMVRYAFSAEDWQTRLTLRYYAPIEHELWAELSGGDVTTDFNPQPYLHGGQAAIAASIFAWDHTKYYRRRFASVGGGWSTGRDVLFESRITYERREARENSRWQSFFGAHVTDNALYDNRLPIDSSYYFPTTEVLRLHLKAAYTPSRRLVILNDMETRSLSLFPTFTAGVEVISNIPRTHSNLADLRRRERWELGIEQTRNCSIGRLFYRGEVGTFTGPHDGLLMDWKHFDASRFGWQSRDEATWFTLLNDYELSTDRSWAMLCTRLEGKRLLLSRWMGKSWPQEVEERIAIRLLKITGAPLHSEVEYAWAIRPITTLGVTLGFADGRYDGVGLRWVTCY